MWLVWPYETVLQALIVSLMGSTWNNKTRLNMIDSYIGMVFFILFYIAIYKGLY